MVLNTGFSPCLNQAIELCGSAQPCLVLYSISCISYEACRFGLGKEGESTITLLDLTNPVLPFSSLQVTLPDDTYQFY